MPVLERLSPSPHQQFSLAQSPETPRSASANSAASNFHSVHSVLPSIGLTKRRRKTLQTIQIVREERDQRKQDLAFNARPFVLCGLPLRRPGRSQLAYTRRNGHYSLTIVGHPEFGLPYGRDRLIPIWAATLALRQKNSVIRFRYLTEFLHYFDLPTTGFYYERTADAFQRIFGSTIFVGTDEWQKQHVFIDWARFHFFDQIQLWYSRDGNPDPAPDSGFQNTIALSDAFFTEIQQHGIPVERWVVAALSNAPGTLDFTPGLSGSVGRQRTERSAFHFSVSKASPSSLEPETMHGTGPSAKRSVPGSGKSECGGPPAPPLFRLTAAV